MTSTVLSKPWAAYKAGVPFSFDCPDFDEVFHICHIPVAFRILEDKCIRADIVSDESILREDRIRVVWTSPNHWIDGYRYGNVRFSFDWESLCRGKRFYWVETIDHKPVACRILITDVDRSSDSRLIPYDPMMLEGPWIRAPGGGDFRNGNFTLEFMIEGDVPLSAVKKLDFVKHHKYQCCIDPSACRYRDLSSEKAAAWFVGEAASRHVSIKTPTLLERVEGKTRAIFDVCSGFEKWIATCNKQKPQSWGNIDAKDPVAQALGRSILASITHGRKDEAALIMAMFKSFDDVSAAVKQVFAQSIGLSDPSGLDF